MIYVVDLWTDGSGTTVGSPGGWAFVLSTVKADGTVATKEGHGRELASSNNRMELTAVIEGLRALKQTSLVVVHTDSQYVMHAFTQDWISKWRKRNWTKVKNVDLWHKLIEQVDRHLVSWEWVKGHSGVTHNERCDVLAGEERRLAIAEQNQRQGQS